MSQILNTVNECDETLQLSVTKNVLQTDFHFSPAFKECDAETLGHLLLSEIGNNAIIARCFHPQILDLVFRCNVPLRRGEQAYVKER
jgi:hypothetical protein